MNRIRGKLDLRDCAQAIVLAYEAGLVQQARPQPDHAAIIPFMASKASYLTLREAARRLGVHESTVRRYADRGLIRAVRLPSGVRRLHRDDVELLAEGDGEPHAGGAPGKTVDALAVEQNVPPLVGLEALAAPDLWRSDEEADLFVVMIRAERDRDR